MKNKQGFTLIEILIVVIIIGILAAFAIPKYLKVIEKANAGKAKNALMLIAKAEGMYRAENDAYLVVTKGTNNDGFKADDDGSDPTLGNYVEMDGVVNDSIWLYSVVAGTGGIAKEYDIIANRNGGGYTGWLIKLKHNGEICEAGARPEAPTASTADCN